MKTKRKKLVGNFYTPRPAPKTSGCGFTLIELLVVIAITALLLSTLMPSLSRARSIAYRLRCASNLKQIGVAVHLYLEGNEDFYPCDANDPLYTDPDTGQKIWLWMGRGWRSFVEPYLSGNIDANNPSVLFCPQDRTAPEKYESTSYSYSMAFYHSPEDIDTLNYITDQYGATSPAPCTPQKWLNVKKPDGKILIGEWTSNHSRVNKDEDKGWWCSKGSRNYLFADGQVQFIKAENIRPARDGCPNPNLTIHGISGIDWPK